MKRIIDRAWETMLSSVLKKRKVIRPELGDDIDLYVPQSRILAMAEAEPEILIRLYASARDSARRNAVSIVGKLGMPTDYFWKFEYWPKARAYATLEKIVNRVFASIMKQAREGELKINEVDIDPLVIDISFSECAECAGFEGLSEPICYYHAGTLAGILSGLINRDLEGYEVECHASGGTTCHFKVCDPADPGQKALFESHMSPERMSVDMVARLEKSLKKVPVRELGNMVDISYARLALANSLMGDQDRPETYGYEAGLTLGRKLAPVLAGYFGGDYSGLVGDHYLQLGEFSVTITESDGKIVMHIRESAEYDSSARLTEMTDFLSGELSGILSGVTGTEMTVEGTRFDGDDLILIFVPKG